MTYHVVMLPPAEDDLLEIYTYIAAEAPLNAERFHWRLRDAIESLANYSKRCGLALENADHREEIRQLVVGNYRILFTIRARDVVILHVRHGARRSGGLHG